MSKTSRNLLMSCTAVAALLVVDAGQSVRAQLDEIVVTSQRREQSILDVPISVSAFDANMIEKSGISEAKDYLAMTPNVSFAESGEAGNRSISISIRGVANVSLGEVASANSIGYYLDELSVGNTANGVINPQLYDMERIEVLRGPQGTYFGRNAAGGALNITTKLPTDVMEGSIEGSYGSFDTWGLNGMINIPISEGFSARFVASYEESDGLVENINPNGAPNSGYEYTHLRGAFRLAPTDNFTMDLSVSYTDEDEGADASVPTGVLDLDTKDIVGADYLSVDNGTGYYPANDDKFDHDAPEFNKSEFLLVNARAQLDFDRFMIRSITGLVDSEHSRAFDQDNIFTDTILRDNEYEGESFSQEVRFQSTGDWGVDWTVGAIYAQDEIQQLNTVFFGAVAGFDHPNIPGIGPDPVLGPGIGFGLPPAGFRINFNERELNIDSWALFGEINWHINDQWDLILGGRYTNDEVTNHFFNISAFENPQEDILASEEFDNFSPRIVLSWDVTPETNLYASASAGYKAGGIDLVAEVNDPDTGDLIQDPFAQPFEEEKLWSYEIGIKGTAADDRIRYNAAVFYTDWEVLQVQSNFLAIPGDISSGKELTQNADGATNWGIEAEVLAELAEGLTMNLGVGWLDSEFDSFPNARLPGGVVVDLGGQRLPSTPEWTWSTALDYRRPLGNADIDGFVRLEANGRSESRSNIEAIAAPLLGLPDFPYESPSFAVVNLRLGIDHDNWGLNGFVENLFEEEYYTSSNDNFGLSGMRVRPHPRVWGVRAKYRFGG